MNCPCESSKTYENCCEPYLLGKKQAPNPEALMRSRYTAYVKAQIPYLRETLAPESRSTFKEKEAREWAKNSVWLGLEVLSAEGDTVRFVAKYKTQGKTIAHHETAKFRKTEDRWYFVDGDAEVEELEAEEKKPQAPMVREEPKIGRNDPCSCGSGKKFKKCCAA